MDGKIQTAACIPERAALWCVLQLGPRKICLLLSAPAPPLVGLSIIGLPHSLGSADGPTLREAADEEFIWADMQRKTIDSFELVKPISSIQNIIQRLAR